MAALNPIFEKIEGLGFDGEAMNVRCLVDSPGADSAGLENALLELESSPTARADADSLAARGKILIGLARVEEARALLEAAARGPSRFPARAWLGQALLLLGRFDEAVRSLDRAAAEETDYAWTYFFRGAAKLGLQDRAGAEADADLFLKRRECAAAFALAGLASASRSGERALALLKRAADAAPSEAWPLVLESFVHRAASDLAPAKDALVAAVARKPSAWLYAELAKTYEQLGILPEAIENAAQAVRLCPCVEHHCLKAHLHGCWRENAESIAEYARAAALRPGDAGLLFSLSKAYSAAGRLPEALRDARAAARLEPGDAHLRCWEIQLLTLTRRSKEAARGVAALLKREGADDLLKANAFFCLGYDALYRGAHADARRALARCLDLSEGSALWRKADFYRVIASMPGRAGAKQGAKRSGPGLYLIGLGVDPPYTATAEDLRALSRCDVLFNNVMGDEMFEFLRPFCADVRPVAYHQNNDEEKLAAEMLAETGPGRTVAFVTRGSAIVQGPLGTLLLEKCRQKKISWACMPAVSSTELLAAKFSDPLLSGVGLAVMDSRGATDVDMTDRRLPLTLFLNMTDAESQYPALCALLSRRYGGAHPCLVLDHVIGQEPMRSTMDALPALRSKLSHSAIFFIPGLTA
jgi:tetratricopeptide (TPR) repeat protein